MKFIYCIRLKELRKLYSYTQADIAYILCIRQEQYSKYENGVRELPIHLLIKLSKIYRVPSDYILGLSDNFSPINICSNGDRKN